MIEVISIAELIELVSHVLLFIKKLNNVRKKYKEIDKRFERLKEDVAQLQLLLEDVGELSEEELLQNETISVRALSSATQHCGDDLQRLISRLEAANTKNMKRFKKFSRKTALSLDDDFFADIEKDVSKHRVDIAAALSLANMRINYRMLQDSNTRNVTLTDMSNKQDLLSKMVARLLAIGDQHSRFMTSEFDPFQDKENP